MSAFDTILDTLEAHGQRTFRQRDSARSQCPGHDSRGQSLSVRRGDGRAFVNCFAGCHDVDVLAAIGLTVADLFDEPGRRGSYRPTPRPAPTPWESSMASIGIHNPPPLEHVLGRMVTEEIKTGVLCGDCLTERPCSCGALRGDAG